MAWTVSVEYKGVDFLVDSDGTIGFDLDKPTALRAVEEKDPTIFEILAWRTTDDFTLFCEAQWVTLRDWGSEYAFRQNYPEDYLPRCLNNPYISDKTKDEIALILAEVRGRQVKRELTKKRRASFQKNRDDLMLALIERDSYICNHCNETEELTVDHITPLSRGGSDKLDNLQLLCRTCNSKKGDKLPQEKVS